MPTGGRSRERCSNSNPTELERRSRCVVPNFRRISRSSSSTLLPRCERTGTETSRSRLFSPLSITIVTHDAFAAHLIFTQRQLFEQSVFAERERCTDSSPCPSYYFTRPSIVNCYDVDRESAQSSKKSSRPTRLDGGSQDHQTSSSSRRRASK